MRVLIAALLLLLFVAQMPRAEEPTRTEDFFYNTGRALGWMWDRTEDAGRGMKRWAEGDEEECAEQVRDMTIECLDELEELARDVLAEIEVERGVRRGRR